MNYIDQMEPIFFTPPRDKLNRALFKGGKGGSKNQTVTQSNTPWSGVQPYITDYLKLEQENANRPYVANPGDTIAGFSPEQEMGMGLATNRALAGSQAMNGANANIAATNSGAYLNPETNPYLAKNVNTALDAVQGRVNGQFNSNAYGSTAHQETLARNLGNTAAGMFGNNYDQERQRMMTGSAMAPALASADYTDANMLANVGQQRQGLSQRYLDYANNVFNNNQNWADNRLSNYGNAVSVGLGAGSNQSKSMPNPNQSNGFANAVGSGLLGYGLASGGKLGAEGSLFATNPWLGAAAFALPSLL